MVVKSFAKLNLYLQVLGKRRDNFHNLSTLFARIDLADTLTFKKRSDSLIKIRCSNRQVPKGRTNLCYRAAQLLKQELNLSSGIEIEIKKRIPVGAGLGGGSSDAAGVLSGLNRFWNLNLTKAKLADLGAKIGSDVPFFIYDTKFASASGRGDKIKPRASLSKLRLWFILVYPKIKVSTPLIYKKYDAYLLKNRQKRLTIPQSSVKILTSGLLKKGKAVEARLFFNSLEPVTASLYSVVNQVKNALINIGLEKTLMTGSGPAEFAICNSRFQAYDLSKQLRKKHKSWQIFVTSTI